MVTIDEHDVVCQELGVHRWTDNCEDAFGRSPYCMICGIDRPPLTDEEIAAEICIVEE